MSALTVEQVGHAYGRRAVLGGVSLAVGKGEVVAITGPSGSGKTTLLSIAGLLLRPDTGRVRLGEDLPSVWDASASERLAIVRSIGWVFQSMNVFGRRSAADNVCLPLLACGWSRKEADDRGRASLAAMGLDDLADTRAAELSGGELQRVCIARALVGAPIVVLADEPTGQLDGDSTVRVVESLRYAASTGAGVLIATHDPEVAGAADRVFPLRTKVSRDA